MTSATEIKEQTQEICDEINAVGAVAVPYSRQPVNRDTFIAGMHRNVIRLWAGIADVETHSDKRRRQAVVNTTEDSRSFEQTYHIGSWTTHVNSRTSIDAYRLGEVTTTPLPSERELKDLARTRFPVDVPRTARFDVKSLDRKEIVSTYVTRTDVRATVRATIPVSTVSLLMGWDETSQFIAALPATAETVKEAHELLRGDVPLGAKRQGEWFFIPAAPHELHRIEFTLRTKGLDFGTTWQDRRGPLESGSSHHAPCQVTVDRQLYALGAVLDSRSGHHAPLILSNWHRVVRNRELTASPASAPLRQRHWD